MNKRALLTIAVTMFAFSGIALACDAPCDDLKGNGLLGDTAKGAHTEGPVTRINYIRVKPGKLEEYTRFLDGIYKKQMDAAQKKGLILGYAVYRTEPSTQQQSNFILTITFPNVAALDGNAKLNVLTNKVYGDTREAENKEFIERGAIREDLGSELVRELILRRSP